MIGAGLCHMEREGLRYLVPVGQEGEPGVYLTGTLAGDLGEDEG